MLHFLYRFIFNWSRVVLMLCILFACFKATWRYFNAVAHQRPYYLARHDDELLRKGGVDAV